MEEAQDILQNVLENSGVSIPSGVSSIRDLTPTSLFSICSQSLRILGDDDEDVLLFPASLPEVMAERFKICTEMAEAIKKLGYMGDMSFHKFLYPSEEDMYKLVRFLIEKLSTTSDSKDESGIINKPRKAHIVPSMINDLIDDVSKTSIHDSCKEESTSLEADKKLPKASGLSCSDECRNKEVALNPSSLNEKSSTITTMIPNLQDLENSLGEEGILKNSSLQLIDEHDLLKAAVEMAFDDQHPVDFNIEQLNSKIDAKRCNLIELKSQWEASSSSLEETNRIVDESLCTTQPEIEKCNKLLEVEQEIQYILSEIRKREKEHSKLCEVLVNQPKVASRLSYIQRITEITKNSSKQDADIERILKETRELQLESNSIQDRLHRTYAVVAETVFREAKRDPLGKQAYKLLTNIHENFEQISKKILTSDRIRREAADHEAKLAGMASRTLNVEKLEADIDAIKTENEYLLKAMPS